MVQNVIFLSIVVASLSFTITETKLFLPLREWAKEKNRFFGDLLCCGYCLGHWIAFVLAAVYRPRVFDFWRPLDYFLTALCIAWLGGIQWVLMSLLMKNADK